MERVRLLNKASQNTSNVQDSEVGNERLEEWSMPIDFLQNVGG